MKILLWHGYLLGGTGSNVYTTPPLTYKPNKKGKKATTYAYFCRIHPLMRGSIRVRK